jgi:hypothetical protein
LQSVTLPESLTSIGDLAFSGSGIESITLPEGLTSIGDSAFYSSSGLTSITLPEGLTSIGDSAFMNCSKLTAINIPASVTNIGSAPFASCRALTAITVDEENACYSSENGLLYDKAKTTLIQCPRGLSGDITLPEGLTSIGDSAFYYCSGLTAITLPESLTSIGDSAFQSCSKLTTVSIPASVTSIGRAPFRYSSALTAIEVDDNNTYYTSEDGLLYDKAKTTLIQYPRGLSGGLTLPQSLTSIGDYAFQSCSKLTAITLPESLTSIGDSAFYGCSGLTAITLPESLTSIGDLAFNNCSKLTAISIPAGVTSIGDRAFLSCRALTAITVDENNAHYLSRDGVLYDKEGTTLIQCPGGFIGTFDVPEGVITIVDNAFNGCWDYSTSKGLTGITLPQSLKYIGDSAFQSCFGLERFNLIIPANVEYIGHGGLGYIKYSSVTFYSPTTIINNEANSMQLDFNTKIIGWDPSTAKDYYRAMGRGYNYTFEALTPRTVTGVPTLSDIYVGIGTTLENIGLPSMVAVALSDGSTQDVEVAWDSATPAYNATKAGTYVFSGTLTNLPVSIIDPEGITVTVNVIVEPGGSQQTPVYTVSPVPDPAYYILGKTEEGINTMTVKDMISGFMYFAVDITPVIPHSGNEATVFTHRRNGVQLSINVTKADFDQVNTAQAGFNVQQNDMVKVYIVDDLTNDTSINPVIFQ